VRAAFLSLPEALQDRFGVPVTVEVLDAPEAADAGEVEGATTLVLAGEPRARLFGLPEDDAAHAFLALATTLLERVQDGWAAAVLADLWGRLGRSGDDDPLPEALERLRLATGADALGIVGYRNGGFVPLVLAGDVEDAILARLTRLTPDDDTPLAASYRGGHAVFLPDVKAARGAPVDDDACIAAVAIRPMPLDRHAHAFLIAVGCEPRRWLHTDRTLVQGAARAVRLHLERERQASLLDRIVTLERRLLAREESAPLQRILETLVDVVPGAEAGSLLVRGEDDLFRFVGGCGYRRDELARVTFSEENLRRWYDGERAGDGAARLLVAPSGIAAASRRAAGVASGALPDLPRIVANLALPVQHAGHWAAFINLDAFATPHAFLEEDRVLMEQFAPIVEFVLYESDVREELRRIASHDPLTQLPNRRAFESTLRRELRRVDRTRTPLALLLMDLDEFKRLNDDHGHAAGDEGLREVARALVRTVRGSDHVFRWGGDEFAALLPDTDVAGAATMVERLRTAVADLETPGADLALSVGVAVHAPGDPLDEDALLSRADAAMYAAKRERGR
jgi:diguanylate cyclase (GGDEF)-like protein